MKITFMMPADDLTGGNRVVAIYAKILQNRGHSVRVVSNAPAPLELRELLRLIRHRRWPVLRQRLWPLPGHIALSGVPHTTLERERPITAEDVPDADFVVATWWETAEWMQALPSAKGRKVHLIQGYEIWGGESVRDKVHAALQLPNLKIAISAGLKREIEVVLGDLAMAVVPNAVDLKLFDAPPRQQGKAPTVGFIYAQAAIKGADRCLKAIELARRQIPNLRVLAFGAELPGTALPLPNDAEYVCRPAQQQLASLYAACDAWLFSSRLDSFGLPILEAMACRTPVIGVPIGAAPDLLADGHGVLLSAEDEDVLVAEMAAAIVRLCRLPASEWQALSEAAYRRARSYSWEDATDRLEQQLMQAAPAVSID
jgi:glycosyltransferase involved in cell wall biosynthesis